MFHLRLDRVLLEGSDFKFKQECLDIIKRADSNQYGKPGMLREKLTSGTDDPNIAHDLQKRVIHGIIQVESHQYSVKCTFY